MSDVISSLKRLERAGSESSVQTEKLIHAARVVGDAIAAAMPKDIRNYGPGRKADLPRAYEVSSNGYLLGHLRRGDGSRAFYSTAATHVSRQDALKLAEDIASGWLDELAEWLDKRLAEETAAATTLDSARWQR